jgi:8-oxo-dGTP pyrophosphatase MutT (NUDIX family)
MNIQQNFSYSSDTREQIERNVSRFDDRRQTSENLRSAAVAITIFEHDGEASVIVTRRSPRLKAHSGQWAMPGGRIDEGEDAISAALRELHEEINLELEHKHVLGTLDDYVTRSGYIITPVVVWADAIEQALHPNPDEVESIHPFTFTELVREDSPNLESIPQSERQVLSMNYLDDVIYAPTAAMLYQFREVAILGNTTRVLDFDQPVFAWT